MKMEPLKVIHCMLGVIAFLNRRRLRNAMVIGTKILPDCKVTRFIMDIIMEFAEDLIASIFFFLIRLTFRHVSYFLVKVEELTILYYLNVLLSTLILFPVQRVRFQRESFRKELKDALNLFNNIRTEIQDFSPLCQTKLLIELTKKQNQPSLQALADTRILLWPQFFKNLHKLIVIICGTVTTLLFTMVWTMQVSKSLLIQLYFPTIVVILNTIFFDTVKNYMHAIVFTLVNTPIEVGEEVKIDGVRCRVRKIHLLSTEVETSAGFRVYFPNHILAQNSAIVNLSLASKLWMTLELKFHYQGEANRNLLLKELGRLSLEYQGSMFVANEVDTTNSMSVTIRVMDKLNNSEHRERIMDQLLVILQDHTCVVGKGIQIYKMKLS